MREKRLVGLDCDDVLANFNIALEKFVHSKYGLKYTRDQIVSYYHLTNIWGCSPEETNRRILEFYDSSKEFVEMTPVAGSVTSIPILRQNNRLIVITARPESIREKTENWFNTYFPNMFEDIIFLGKRFQGGGTSKGEACKKLGVEFFVDDHVKNIHSVSEVGIPSLLFDCPWNQGEPLPKLSARVFGWEDIVRYFI